MKTKRRQIRLRLTFLLSFELISTPFPYNGHYGHLVVQSCGHAEMVAAVIFVLGAPFLTTVRASVALFESCLEVAEVVMMCDPPVRWSGTPYDPSQ